MPHESQPVDASLVADSDAPSDADEEQADVESPEQSLVECGYPEDGYGYWEGRPLQPFELWDCEGELTTLPRLWCGKTVTIVHLSVAHCGVCAEDIYELNQIVMTEFSDDNVALFDILIEIYPSVAPGLDECDYWTRAFEPTLTTYIPPDERLDGPLQRFFNSEGAPTTAVLDSEGTIRIWYTLIRPTDFVARVRSLLE